MHSGNHGLVNPLTTILEASKNFQDNDRVRFLFVGGGKGKQEIDEFIQDYNPKNVISLPYQSLNEIKYSLSAADIHFASIGSAMVGCIHPCMFYGALALQKPIILLGPVKSHVGDILEGHRIGWQIDHSDNVKAKKVFEQCISSSEADLRKRGKKGQDLIKQSFSKQILCGKFCDLIEKATTKL